MSGALRSLAAFAGISTCLAGCQTGTEPADGVRIQLPGTIFYRPSAGPAIVAFTITNLSSQRVYVSRCGTRIMTAVDQYRAGQWSQYSGDGCYAIYGMSPLALDPGVSITGSRAVGEAGRFRLRAGATKDPQQDYTWDIGLAVFEVR
jgi:hypothetical protein